ncbi:regulator of protease activity HflC (stomatin/prohibitin superfamily) [Rhodopirellula rubra]|uniref:Regulator of protease activity HflC (Stomatin/prohibitin superfamily) n=1 Tax=Aporhodopirellula rubra TaxID=980271 RepID=A0A7W5H5A2_9BACT|nr:SPFH domain-containing protein [Aporhodopirellula rubra]MBB3207247.1 regulator of protease activity HflC (stomatin/prohibitin superfamily) [Aporhodopirellula rubra]
MIGLRYLKSTPTTYLMRFRNGQIRRHGAGISMFYWTFNSIIVRVNLASEDLPFVFEQQTSDFQDVTIQGNMTYRVADPQQLAKKLDFSIDARGRYQSDDPDSIRDRLVRMLQVEANEFSRQRSITEMLTAGPDLTDRLQTFASKATIPRDLGLEIESVVLLQIKPTPEMESALQAETREATLQKADLAVHERRKSAIAAEQEIRERELQNERITQEKQREVREAELAADVAIELGREELVRQQAANEKTLASARAETLRQTFDAMSVVDWKTIAASSESTDAKQLIAMAFGELAENAQKIGRLDISPDLLRDLMGDTTTDGSNTQNGSRRRKSE